MRADVAFEGLVMERREVEARNSKRSKCKCERQEKNRFVVRWDVKAR